MMYSIRQAPYVQRGQAEEERKERDQGVKQVKARKRFSRVVLERHAWQWEELLRKLRIESSAIELQAEHPMKSRLSNTKKGLEF